MTFDNDSSITPRIELHRHADRVEVIAWHAVEAGRVMARETVSLRQFQYIVHVTMPPPLSYMSGAVKRTDEARLREATDEAAARASDLVVEKLHALSQTAEEATP